MSDYYLIGTKYGDHNNESIMAHLLQRDVIAIGFAWNTDLTNYYNKDGNELETLLKGQGDDVHTIRQMKCFMGIKPGDIIALKGNGAPKGRIPRLEIVGYAVVTERNGATYKYDGGMFPQGLGHTINVDFIEHDIIRNLELGYGQTIYNIKSQDRIDSIFGTYAKTVAIAQKHNENILQRNLGQTLVNVTANYLRTTRHVEIQQKLFNKLTNIPQIEIVKTEEDFVDMVVRLNGKTFLIEIKPFNSPKQCIREGIGQLLSYYERSKYERSTIKILIVGNESAREHDLQFIDFIKGTLNIPFDYKGCMEVDENSFN